MKILSVGIVLGAFFTLTPAASPDNYNAEVAKATCYDYKGNAYKLGETYIEFKGGRTCTCSLAGLPDCAQIAQDGCNICHLQAVIGPCRGYFERWYYNVDARNCKQFIYGGCQGNQNRFMTYKGCMNKCEGQ